MPLIISQHKPWTLHSVHCSVSLPLQDLSNCCTIIYILFQDSVPEELELNPGGLMVSHLFYVLCLYRHLSYWKKTIHEFVISELSHRSKVVDMGSHRSLQSLQHPVLLATDQEYHFVDWVEWWDTLQAEQWQWWWRTDVINKLVVEGFEVVDKLRCKEKIIESVFDNGINLIVDFIYLCTHLKKQDTNRIYSRERRILREVPW